MTHFVLLLLTFNAQTGGFVKSEVVDASYETADQCMAAAIQKGPRPVVGGLMEAFTCRSDRPADMST